MIQNARSFLNDPFNKILVLVLLVLGAYAFLNTVSSDVSPVEPIGADENVVVHFFFMPTCPHCADQHLFNEVLQQDYNTVNGCITTLRVSRETKNLFDSLNNTILIIRGLAFP